MGVQVLGIVQRHLFFKSSGFPVIPRGPTRNFKTSNGSLKTLPTSIRGRLWKVCFLGPRHGSAGSPVICEGPERVSQGRPVGILWIPWNIQNR